MWWKAISNVRVLQLKSCVCNLRKFFHCEILLWPCSGDHVVLGMMSGSSTCKARVQPFEPSQLPLIHLTFSASLKTLTTSTHHEPHHRGHHKTLSRIPISYSTAWHFQSKGRGSFIPLPVLLSKLIWQAIMMHFPQCLLHHFRL